MGKKKGGEQLVEVGSLDVWGQKISDIALFLLQKSSEAKQKKLSRSGLSLRKEECKRADIFDSKTGADDFANEGHAQWEGLGHSKKAISALIRKNLSIKV